MAAFLTGLAGWGSNMAQGYVAGKEERVRQQQQESQAQLDKTRLDMQMQQLRDYESEAPLRKLLQDVQLKKARRDLEEDSIVDAYTADGTRVSMYTTGPNKGKLVVPEDDPRMPNPYTQLVPAWTNFISQQPKERQQQLTSTMNMMMLGHAKRNDITKALTEEAGKPEAMGSMDIEGLNAVIDNRKDLDEDLKKWSKERADFTVRYTRNPDTALNQVFTEVDQIQKSRNKARQDATQLQGWAGRLLVPTQTTLDQAKRLVQDIDNAGQANNNTGRYFLKSYLRYRVGQMAPNETSFLGMFGEEDPSTPEGKLKNDIAGFSLGSVIEATSVLQGSTRSYQAIEKALVHTPNPLVDSPALARHKLVHEIIPRLQEMVDSINKYGKKNSTVFPAATYDTGAATGDTEAAPVTEPSDSPAAPDPNNPMGINIPQ